MIHNGNPQQWFLHQLVDQFVQSNHHHRNTTNNNKPLIANIGKLEFDNDVFAPCDSHRFILPTALFCHTKDDDNGHHHQQQQHHNAAVMPLLRSVGISHLLRILAALVSERRIVFCSASCTRLTQCSHAALSLLNAGGLSWQHVYIPVLCPHLHTMLAAPYPYLIGILQASVLNTTDGVGEVLLVHLDSNRLETRGIPAAHVMARLPDLVCQSSSQQSDYYDNDGNTTSNTMTTAMTACDVYIQDLSEVLKQDKRFVYGEESALEKVGETAQKAKEVVRKTFNKLRDRFQQSQLQSSRGYYNDNGATAATPTSETNMSTATADTGSSSDGAFGDASSSASLSMDAMCTESCHNETAEHDVRVATCTFFLTFYGDVRWYLTKGTNGTVTLDRNRFLQQKQRDYPLTSPMWQLAQNFCQTQLLEEFAKARIADIIASSSQQQQQPGYVNHRMLFLQCEQYLRQKHLDFGVATVQRIARHIADNSPVRLTGMPMTDARPTAMNLTCNKAYESPDTNRMMAQLVDQCRECTSVLPDVMSVVWLRLRDCKGLQWKHAVLALQLLRNLLYHGPLTAITEATDGLAKIRSLKRYENNIRPQCAQQVQSAATSVYSLLVDRAKLFLIRRRCADRRRKVQDPSANGLQVK
jgi:DENN (AEX-3) domain/ENTH domain